MLICYLEQDLDLTRAAFSKPLAAAGDCSARCGGHEGMGIDCVCLAVLYRESSAIKRSAWATSVCRCPEISDAA